jgi:hypothetical protein
MTKLIKGYFDRKKSEKSRRAKSVYYLAHSIFDFNNPECRSFNRVRE